MESAIHASIEKNSSHESQLLNDIQPNWANADCSYRKYVDTFKMDGRVFISEYT